MVFYKTRPESITEHNLHSIICVYSMLDSPTEALYHSLHYIYTPSLLKVIIIIIYIIIEQIKIQYFST